jgi:hypothetical protein
MGRQIHGSLILQVVQNCIKILFQIGSDRVTLIVPMAVCAVRLRIGEIGDRETGEINGGTIVLSVGCVDGRRIVDYTNSSPIRRGGIVLEIIECIHVVGGKKESCG